MTETSSPFNAFRDTFHTLLADEDRAGCIRFALEGLAAGHFDIPDLYERILTPALLEEAGCDTPSPDCIWREHVASSIIRSVIECCHPHVADTAASRPHTHGVVLVLCPEHEYHELGARMVADFFTLCGWKTSYAGANLPRAQAVAVLDRLRPEMVAISVTDFYNLVEAEKLVADIRRLCGEKGWPTPRICAGGIALSCRGEGCRQLHVDCVLSTYADIQQLPACRGMVGKEGDA